MKGHIFKYELGIKAKSNISGFKGIIVSRSQHLNGCDRYWIAPLLDKDGNLNEGFWFDEGKIESITKPILKRKNINNGGFPNKLK